MSSITTCRAPPSRLNAGKTRSRRHGPGSQLGHRALALDRCRHGVSSSPSAASGPFRTSSRSGSGSTVRCRTTERDPQAVLDFLEQRGVEVVDWSGWELLDAHEQQLGEPHGRERIKVVPREEMLATALGRR